MTPAKTIYSVSVTLVALLCLLVFSNQAKAQIANDDKLFLKQMEDTMSATIDSMYSVQLVEDREVYARKFARELVKALKVKNSYQHDFPIIAERMNIIDAPDKSFRIFNWVIAPTEVTRRYYGAIQMPGEALKLHGLVDCSNDFVKGMEDSVFTNGRWYGALYYRIMQQEVDGRKVFILFGINDGAIISTKKVLDPMVITPSGPVFGMPIFAVSSELNKGQPVQRFMLEYKKDAIATLNWKEDYQAIVFDKLISENNDPNRKYTYVPSGQYDGLKWNGTRFDYISDLIPVTILKEGELPQGGRE